VRAEPKAERVVTTTSITINRLISWDGMGWEGASGAEGGASCNNNNNNNINIIYITIF